MLHNKTTGSHISLEPTAVFTLALRLVTGWTYFSAFWRRLVLTNKLDPDSAGYIGEKFNHFLPNALLIKPGIEYLVSNENALWWFMLLFTIVEAIVGLLFMLGFLTRLMSIGVVMLAMGILLGAGWLGTTCLDEWQIGVLGIAAGFTIFLSGGGRYSLDYNVGRRLRNNKWRGLCLKLGSGRLQLPQRSLHRISGIGAACIFVLTLATNQYFHGGVWGKLHNLSVTPHITISDVAIKKNNLSFILFRDQGADVYGSFLIAIRLRDEQRVVVMEKEAEDLASISPDQISNYYVARVKPGKHSLLIPLGARARIQLDDPALSQLLRGVYTLELTDISGIQWEHTITL